MMIMRAHASNAAFLLKNIKHFGKKNLKFSNCFFQRTRVATAVFAAVCGSFVLSEPVPAADDFTADQLEVLRKALTTTNLEGPFRFEYVTDAPKRVGYYYAPETPPFNKKHSILIKESINENLFQRGGVVNICA